MRLAPVQWRFPRNQRRENKRMIQICFFIGLDYKGQQTPKKRYGPLRDGLAPNSYQALQPDQEGADEYEDLN